MSLLIWERQITVISGPPQECEEWQFGSLVRIRQGDCNVRFQYGADEPFLSLVGWPAYDRCAAKTVIPRSVHSSAGTKTGMERCAAVSIAKRLTEIFNIGIETCAKCGAAKVIACIEDPVVIDKILTHLHEKTAAAATGLLPAVRAAPQAGLFD